MVNLRNRYRFCRYRVWAEPGTFGNGTLELITPGFYTTWDFFWVLERGALVPPVGPIKTQ